MSKKIIIAVVAILVVVVAAGTFYYLRVQEQKRVALEKKIRQETLIVSFDQMPQTLNPLLDQNAAGLTLLDPLFDGLSNRTGLKVRSYKNGLAADFIQDEDKYNIFTIELDPDKRWHDDPNHLVTSRDVRFTYECIVNENNRSPLRGRINQLIDRIDIVDKVTLRVVFKENISVHVVRDLLAFKIIPSSYYGKAMSVDLLTDPVAQEFAKSPVGTGPFKFREWQGNKILYTLVTAEAAIQEEKEDEEDDDTAAADSTKKHIKIQRIESILVHDLEKQVRMLMDGKIDLMLETTPKLHEMMDEVGLKNSEYIPLHYYAIAFNTDIPYFSKKLVRQAVSQSINRYELAQQVWDGSVSRFINKGPFPHNDDKRYSKFKNLLPYNQQRAHKYLKKKGGFTATLIYQADASKTMERLAGKISLALADVGITVEAKGLGMAFETQLANKSFELALVRQSGFTDGYNIADLYRSGSAKNISGFRSEKLDKLFDRWENSAFWETRLPVAKQIHKYVLDQSPYIFLFSLPTRAYYSSRLEEVTIVDPNALMGSVSSWLIVAQ